MADFLVFGHASLLAEEKTTNIEQVILNSDFQKTYKIIIKSNYGSEIKMDFLQR